MKALVTAFISLFAICIGTIWGADDFAARAWQMESKGDAAEARDYLQRAAQTGAVDAQLAYAARPNPGLPVGFRTRQVI